MFALEKVENQRHRIDSATIDSVDTGSWFVNRELIVNLLDWMIEKKLIWIQNFGTFLRFPSF